jgi:predicted oxidoreductase
MNLFTRIQGLGSSVALLCAAVPYAQPVSSTPARAGKHGSMPDVVVIGAGIAGISTALEASEQGARVLVIDMNSQPGGHALMSSGGIFIAGSPLQKQYGIEDSPDLAYREWIKYGEDADRDWVRYYVDNSVTGVYRWLEEQGVRFAFLMHVVPEGNSVPRHHVTEGQGRGLMIPLIRKMFLTPNIEFRESTFAIELVTREGRVEAVRARNVRTGVEQLIGGRTFVIATGGFASNLKMVERYWPSDLPRPARALAGSGVNSLGYGHEMAEAAGARLANMDHFLIYPTGVPHPLRGRSEKGIETISYYLWVDSNGKRFHPARSTSEEVAAMLALENQFFWSLFDSAALERIYVTGSDWQVNTEEKRKALFGNPELVKSADNLESLAIQMQVPVESLKRSISQYNEQALQKIAEPPFYAMKHFPLVRKTMGGIKTNLKSQVLDKEAKVISGLYAAGEAAGFGGGGINGKRALEGTFLGPCVLTGRVAGRHAAEEAIRMKSLEAQPVVFQVH